MDGRGIGGVLDLALVRQRRRNGGYADLAVAAVETWFVAAGVFTGLRRIVLGHCLLRGNSNSQPFACWAGFRSSLRWRASAAEMRNKSCPIVTFQTERKGEISCSRWPLRSMSGRPSGRLFAYKPAAPPTW